MKIISEISCVEGSLAALGWANYTSEAEYTQSLLLGFPFDPPSCVFVTLQVHKKHRHGHVDELLQDPVLI
ncbi:hypothetical protein [Pseudogracilibacillus auburnensis]|uniref:hypothetical protein n=1 Tax=Pseudogracilibacillus auburnensis TaxID=1494959 RepID=UPI000D770AF9|nr:hypothetical protein [Pseudogracilibacillus auburnensis]